MIEEKKLAIDLNLFKYVGFYQLVNPNGPKVFNYNVYHVVHITLVVVTSAATALGVPGVLFRANRTVENSFKDIPSLFYMACITVGNIKVITIVYHSDQLWRLFDVASESFLASKHCRANHRRVVECGRRFAALSPWYFFLFFMTGFSWITLPLVVNRHPAAGAEHVPKSNVANLRYPISTDTYNEYYGALYVMEAVMCGYGAFGLVIFDLFLIAILQLISVQYENISSAYEHFRFKADRENGDEPDEIGDDFRSITLDSQKLYKQLEIIYRISRPITLVYMVTDAVGMITMPYSIVLCYVKHGSSIFNTDVLTFTWTLCVAGVQSYIYCSLFQRVTEKKEAVSFGLYCCDWTWLDVRTKKLVLLTMRVNGSNNLKMKATPTRFIDLAMLSVIVRTSYNITSVMINRNIDKMKQYQWQ